MRSTCNSCLLEFSLIPCRVLLLRYHFLVHLGKGVTRLLFGVFWHPQRILNLLLKSLPFLLISTLPFFCSSVLKILTKRTLDPYQKSWSPTRCTLSWKLDYSLAPGNGWSQWQVSDRVVACFTCSGVGVGVGTWQGRAVRAPLWRLRPTEWRMSCGCHGWMARVRHPQFASWISLSLDFF